MKYPEHGSLGYRLLAALIWKPYYWAVYRPEPELRVFMIKRRVWGGERITQARRAQLAELYHELCQVAEMGA